MSRVACLAAAAALGMYGASCFVTPMAPRTAPEAGAVSSAAFQQFPAAEVESQASAWSPLAIGAALGLLIAVAGGKPALAADLENGESIFNGNCTSCHAGGNNTIVAEKKLKKDALEKYLTGGYSVASIMTQVTNGKNSMPAFGEKLGPDDIDDVANYVYAQASKW
mmetsp:Transcript_103934/g.270607  ORF Transcript_103934/g.270607 Transcript_103934/m.270607 type:complete len:166 (+) Transcript_103934:74-571(+)